MKHTTPLILTKLSIWKKFVRWMESPSKGKISFPSVLLKQQRSILGGIKSLRLKKMKTTKEPVLKQKQKRKDIFSSLSSGSFFFCWINALSAARYVEEVKAIFGSQEKLSGLEELRDRCRDPVELHKVKPSNIWSYFLSLVLQYARLFDTESKSLT